MVQPASFAEFQTTTTTERVFQVVKSAVIKLELPPGSKISEAEIAKSLGISRQPVRDAFYRLSELGFLNIRPQKATRVTLISEQALLDARFNRMALEVECLREAIDKVTDADIEMLQKLIDEQAQAIKDKQQFVFHDLDDRFHQAIADIAEHPNAWSLIKGQKAHIDRVRCMTLGERASIAYGEHVDLLKHIKARDTASAEESLRLHLYSIIDVFKSVRLESPEYFVA